MRGWVVVDRYGRAEYSAAFAQLGVERLHDLSAKAFTDLFIQLTARTDANELRHQLHVFDDVLQMPATRRLQFESVFEALVDGDDDDGESCILVEELFE